jgi:hypothetical protein
LRRFRRKFSDRREVPTGCSAMTRAIRVCISNKCMDHGPSSLRALAWAIERSPYVMAMM